MFKKLFVLTLFFILQITKAQNDFITTWQPGLTTTTTVDAPYAATSDQIWFPGIGENYSINWEEVGFPAHSGTMNNVTSTKQVLIDFGTPLNPGGSAAAKYKVKVRNGSGTFKQIRFGEATLVNLGEMILPIWEAFGSSDKILEIEQWGDISWLSMNGAFATCRLLKLTATDIPNLNNVTDASFMFSNTPSFNGAPSMQNWDTSHIINFGSMFSRLGDNTLFTDVFNPPYFNSWDMSSAQDISYMFAGRGLFNQDLNAWNTSNVKNMAWTFGSTRFNERINNWDTSNVTNMEGMFHYNTYFDQPIGNWNTSKVTLMGHMLHGCTSFNQPIESWNVSKVTSMGLMLSGDLTFNQSLGNWNLAALTNGSNMLFQTVLNCENYSKTLSGWADNPNTANNIALGLLSSLQYASNAVIKRDMLLSKGWLFSGDTQGSCFLSTSDNSLKKSGGIYPNPATDNIHTDLIHDAIDYKILDTSGRMVMSGKLNQDTITISSLSKGNYILQIVSKDKIQNFKFIKK
ncbi:surface protein [Chryseobacterium ginsenosidimutans]|uniref:BspA family leucine-rich repeat surface protein n=1 Tax=Chryseobacterium ginsenosidimutans TaxID=687846 RepID=UPI00278A7579|nr:BspA family leucine-rich repeat surface protein [Chryseobacterium ginsenosidimutans]MDQ0593271.1 surface protein [Chryseobacterium ginsenosidimutans]